MKKRKSVLLKSDGAVKSIPFDIINGREVLGAESTELTLLLGFCELDLCLISNDNSIAEGARYNKNATRIVRALKLPSQKLPLVDSLYYTVYGDAVLHLYSNDIDDGCWARIRAEVKRRETP